MADPENGNSFDPAIHLQVPVFFSRKDHYVQREKGNKIVMCC